MVPVNKYEGDNEQASIKIFEESRKRKQRNTILLVIAVAAVTVFLLLTKFSVLNQKYDSAKELMVEGQYDEAIAAFTEIVDYRDSAEQINACETVILDGKYDSAKEMMVEGQYDEAIAAFAEIMNYRDSAKQINACKYEAAVTLMNEDKYREAYESFVALNGYEDSAAKAMFAYRQYKHPELEKADTGSYITFGAYEQDADTSNGKEDIEWLVLKKENNRLLVISRYALDCQPYHKTNEYITEATTWESCSLRRWMNNDFLNDAFSNIEQAMIPMASVDKFAYVNISGHTTPDKVFLLDKREVNWWYFDSDSVRQCEPTVYARTRGAWVSDEGFSYWWLRAPGDTLSDAVGVNASGVIDEHGSYVDRNDVVVRPALWIDLNP